MSKGKKKWKFTAQIFGRPGVLHEGGSLNGWKLPSLDSRGGEWVALERGPSLGPNIRGSINRFSFIEAGWLRTVG
jgi:hypothetical protein